MNSIRLIPGAEANQEWAYLVNETLEGEKCIVPLLVNIMRDFDLPEQLRESLKRQRDEEAEHVRMFGAVLGNEKLNIDLFKTKFAKYVQSLPSVTLRLFALQGMLEGIALGALRYRMAFWGDSPSSKVDRRAFAEELGHVSLSYTHFEELKRYEQPVSKQTFQSVAKEINSIFANGFSGESIAQLFKDSFGCNADPKEIATSDGMLQFRRLSIRSIIENRDSFIAKYEASAVYA
jgi:hypothetical protein